MENTKEIIKVEKRQREQKEGEKKQGTRMTEGMIEKMQK